MTMVFVRKKVLFPKYGMFMSVCIVIGVISFKSTQ